MPAKAAASTAFEASRSRAPGTAKRPAMHSLYLFKIRAKAMGFKYRPGFVEIPEEA